MINKNNEINNLIKAVVNKTEYQSSGSCWIPPIRTKSGFSGRDLEGGKGIWCRRLELWRKQAQKEIFLETKKSLNFDNTKADYAILPKSFYSKIQSYDQTKKYDFCFIGASYLHNWEATNSFPRPIAKEKRRWIFSFIHNYFNKNSYLRFTDSQSIKYHSNLGEFDYTGKSKGFCPKENPVIKRGEFDEDYYKIMCSSKFCLCPGGDNHWSMRFYEALMCKTIPIISYENEKCRTPSECLLDYKYYLVDDTIKNYNYNKDWADHNYNLFLKYHTYEYIDKIN